jgi:DNA ligase (NAD+)
MDIEGLGDKMVGLLLEHNVVQGLPDIYDLTVEKLRDLPRMGELSSSNLVQAIAESKKRALGRFIFALGIRHVGTKTAQVIARNVRSVHGFVKLTEEELLGMEEIGPETARSVSMFLEQDRAVGLVQALLDHGVHPTAEAAAVTDGPLSGKTFVVTGTLASMSRKEAEDLVTSHGGKISSSVSKKTSYVVVGENPGSKVDAARKFGVTILSEDELKGMVGRGVF